MKKLLLLIVCLLSACAATKVKLFETPEDQFEYARGLYDQKKYPEATEAFESVLFRFHGSALADSVNYFTGMCYFNQKEYVSAVAEFKRLLTNYPNSPLADDAQYLIAKAYFLDAPRNVGLEQESIKEAVLALNNFFEDFPNSSLMPRASELMDSCYSRQAYKDYRVGELYYKMRDFAAARIYLEAIVTKQTGRRWVGRSLFLLGEMDFQEKHYEDARTKFKNFLANFPQHEWAQKASKRLKKAEAKLDASEPRENASGP